MVSLTIFSY